MRARPPLLPCLVLVVLFASSACGTTVDAQPECTYDQECDSRSCGDDGHCVDICAGTAHGVVCTSYDTADCCGPDSICCYSGFEHMSCFPAADGCPVVCPHTFSDLCGNGQICAYAAEDLAPSGMCELPEYVTCVDSCPVEQQCGYALEPMCCGAGTTCVDGCCVRPLAGDPPDAGLPDGGTPDAS